MGNETKENEDVTRYVSRTLQMVEEGATKLARGGSRR